jgi:hypothetical protein
MDFLDRSYALSSWSNSQTLPKRFIPMFQPTLNTKMKKLIGSPSYVHGKVAPAGFQQVLNDAINAFVVDKNADTLVQALAQAAKEAAMNK